MAEDKASPFVANQTGLALNRIGQYGASAYIAGNQTMYQTWTWLNYSKMGSLTTGVVTGVGPISIQSSTNIHSLKYYKIGEFFGFLYSNRKELKE